MDPLVIASLLFALLGLVFLLITVKVLRMRRILTTTRTVHPLSKNKTLDMFELRNRFAVLNPLLDTEYGSATFIKSNSAEEFRVMVSTTGLLIRKTEKAP